MRVDNEKLRLLRQAMRCPQGTLAEYMGLPQPHLSEMEGGGRSVPVSVAQRFSFLTGFSPSYLAKPVAAEVPVGSNLWYRKRKNKYRKTEQAQDYCQLVFDTFEPLTKSLKPRPSRLSTDEDCSSADAAMHVRHALGLRPNVPVESLTSLAEKAGIRVIGVGNPILDSAVPITLDDGDPEDDGDFEAFSFWTKDRLPVVFIRSDIAPDRFNWALGHELIHLVMHRSHHGDVRQAEHDAQTGASEFFLPQVPLRDVFPATGISVRYLTGLATRWNVSLTSVVLRYTEMGLITDGNKRYYMGAVNRGAGDTVRIKSRPPTFYRQMVELLYGKPIRVTEMARDTGASQAFIRDVLIAHGAQSSDFAGLDGNGSKEIPFDRAMEG